MGTRNHDASEAVPVVNAVGSVRADLPVDAAQARARRARHPAARFVLFMKIFSLLLTAVLASNAVSQKPVSRPASKLPSVVSAVPVAKTDENGQVSGRIYTNTVYGFRITFPDAWLIPGRDFEDHMKSQGFDISLKAPVNVGRAGQLQVAKSLEKVKILVTGYRALPGSKDNALMRVAVEDLSMTPQVKD